MPDIPLSIGKSPAGDGVLTDEQVACLLATAGRAPSLHNTQPWRFRVHENGLDLYGDPDRRLRAIDPDGREMLISCGAALFGLRLGIRHLGYQAAVELLPEPGQPSLLARVRLGRAGPAQRRGMGHAGGGAAPAHAPRAVQPGSDPARAAAAAAA